MANPIQAVNGAVEKLTNWIPTCVIAIMLRLSMFFVFWPSAQTKIIGPSIAGQKWQFWNLGDNVFLLFAWEYQLPLIPTKFAAYSATLAEFFLALALLFGLFTRLSAFGLLMITAVIQIFVYPDAWKLHLTWAAILVAIMHYGPGRVSIDSLMKK